MRTAVLFNFLLEANLMASAAILLMIVFRKFLRKPLGSRLIYFLWLLVAVRLLVPLALPTVAINDYRPFYLTDEALRPIAGQIKVRISDMIESLSKRPSWTLNTPYYQTLEALQKGLYFGTLSSFLCKVYFCGVAAALAFFGISNARYQRSIKRNRIEPISGKLLEDYLALCKARNIKPVPVWLADPLPSACLVGVIRPYIALPLTVAPADAVHVLTHEVCHIKGRDHWFSVLRLLSCAVHWFNPLVWLAAYMSRTDCELACDERVVDKATPEERLGYTNTLVQAVSRRYAPGVGVLATGMTMTGKKLKSRVRSILSGKRTVKWLMVAVALLCCMALPLSFFTAEADVNAGPYLSQLTGFRSVVAGGLDGLFSDLPSADGLSITEALDIALQAIHDQYGADIDDLSRYGIGVDYMGSNARNPFMDSCWVFVIADKDIHTGSYDVYVRASDGRILDIGDTSHG